MMLRCMIVDDEPLVRELLEDYVGQVPFLHLAGSYKTALEAVEPLLQQEVDLVFLDIQMPRLNGLQLLQSLRNPPLAIIISAYDEYAVEGFNLQVVDYIVKPFPFERFLKACNRAAELFQTKHPTQEFFFVNVEYSHVKIVTANIEYIEGLKDYIKIYLSSKPQPVVTRLSLKAIEERLPPGEFIRTHKSFLVALSRITTIKRDLVCLGTKEIPVSETYRGSIEKVLKL